MTSHNGTERSSAEVETGKKDEMTVDLSPPSPFLKGWKSVNAADYPYFIPNHLNQREGVIRQVKEKEANRTDSVIQPQTQEINLKSQPLQDTPSKPPEATSTDITHSTSTSEADKGHSILNRTVQKPPLTRPPITQQAPMPDAKLNTDRLFIKKPKPPARNLNTPSQRETPLFKPASQPVASDNGNDQDDPFANWGSPDQDANEEGSRIKKRTKPSPVKDSDDDEDDKEKEEEDMLASREEEKEGIRFEELEKTLKLDRNLLEIIVRSVIVKIKLLNARESHKHTLEILENFKTLTRGMHRNHSTMYERKLREGTGKIRVIQSEFENVTRTIEENLRSTIEACVSKHLPILDAPRVDPRGLFPDHWRPKPVECVLSIPHPTPHQHGQPPQPDPMQDTHSRFQEPQKTTENTDAPWAESWGDDAATTQTVNPAPDPAPENNESACPWGDLNDDPIGKPIANPTPAAVPTNPSDSCGWGDTNSTANMGDDGGAKPNAGSGGWGAPDPPGGLGFPAAADSGGRDQGWSGRGMRGGRGNRGGRRGGFGGGENGFERGGFRGRGRGIGGDRGGFGGDNTGWGATPGGWGGGTGGDNTGWGDTAGGTGGERGGYRGRRGGFNGGGRGGFDGDRGGGRGGFGGGRGGFGGTQGFQNGAASEGFGAWDAPKPAPINRQAVAYDTIAPAVPDSLNEWGPLDPNGSATASWADSSPANPPGGVASKADPLNENEESHSKPAQQTNGDGDAHPKPTQETPKEGKSFNDWDGATELDGKTAVLDYEGTMAIDPPVENPPQTQQPAAQSSVAPEVPMKPADDEECADCKIYDQPGKTPRLDADGTPKICFSL
ncbi:hypothetical protein PCANC_05681 [Puccinia coronata f. sp. avenae]|uniref:Uncharacterized protein n=1 Tax=Puccinia coronata f. sp. avenae TaxID=200324 RepID=A0A2N5VXS8_9BASI|nr:hypothetical protein PCASD_09032 [Puccinia coronata f. sp. avenae]PLW54803.1 hypothetical protein PCANC_05681 [Puccinia coronata f. sp. avenae]